MTRPILHSGRDPNANVPPDGLTIKRLANRFLAYRRDLGETGQITPRSFADYRRGPGHFACHIGHERLATEVTANELVRCRHVLFGSGLTGIRGLGVHALTRALTQLRATFRWAETTGLIDRVPRRGNALGSLATVTDKRRSRTARERQRGKILFGAA